MFKTPLYINWSLSTKCNFNCQHCYSRLEKNIELTLEDNKKIVDVLAKYKIPFINFGGGEPILYKNLFEITDYATENGLHISISSNGFLINEEVAEKIKKAKISKVEISIDSHIPSIHDDFRNMKGSFERACNAVRELKKQNIVTDISSVICKINYNNFSELVKLAMDLGARKISLHNFKCSGLGFCNRHELDLTPEEWKDFYSKSLKLKKDEKNIIISLDDPIITSLNEYQNLKDGEHSKIKGSICGKISLAIKPNGDITPCGFLPLPIGNILKEDLILMWENSPILKSMRNKEAKGKCKSCSHYTECVGGCTSRAFAITGDINSPDPHCWIDPK